MVMQIFFKKPSSLVLRIPLVYFMFQSFKDFDLLNSTRD